MFGLDYVSGPSMDALKAAHVGFVCRYMSEVNDLTKIKLLTLAEAHELSQNGVAIVSNFEWYGNRALEGHAAGVADAQIAESQHLACGGPNSAPIYFSVDFNAQAANMPAILDYFHGVASVIGVQRTGAYGGYDVIKFLFDQGAIAWGWQTYAWSRGLWDPRAHIQQYQNGMSLDGKAVDYDRSMLADFGQWRISMAVVPSGWHDDGATLTAPNGVPVVLGFRQYILNRLWDPANVPLAKEFYPAHVELHDQALGSGSLQIFRDSVLVYTQEGGVFAEEHLGLEIAAAYALIAQLQAQSPAVINPDVFVALDTANAALQKAIGELPKPA